MTGSELKPLSDWELAREFLAFRGAPKALRTLGYLSFLGIFGTETANEMAERFHVTPPERTTWWRVHRDLRDFAVYMKAKGYDLAPEQDDVVPLARMVLDAFDHLRQQGRLAV